MTPQGGGSLCSQKRRGKPSSPGPQPPGQGQGRPSLRASVLRFASHDRSVHVARGSLPSRTSAPCQYNLQETGAFGHYFSAALFSFLLIELPISSPL